MMITGNDCVSASVHQPMQSGMIEINNVERRPTKSAKEPEISEPTGVAKLWTLAEK